MNPTPDQIASQAEQMRQARLNAPRRTSAEAYAQMDAMRKAQLATATSPEWNGNGSASGRGPKKAG